MSFELQDKETIQGRIVNNLENITDKTKVEGSFSRDLINANSIEFENAYTAVNLLAEAGFAQTSWGDYLTRRASEYGIDRKAATKAHVTLKLTGTAGATAVAGSLFATTDGLRFYSDRDTTIGADGSATVTATAETAGEAGNVAAGTIVAIPMSIAGVRGVTNPAPAIDGFTQESDADLLARYLLAVRTPATSGNKNHYYEWAISVPGVGAAKVLPLVNGPGTVGVIILNEKQQTASADIIAAVATKIESVRPVGATVTVTSPAPLLLNITVDIDGILDKTVLSSKISAYIRDKGLNLSSISVSRIGQYIMEQSTVNDYANLLINGKTKVTIGNDNIFAVGTITAGSLEA